MISEEHTFIYIHIIKTGGTSLEKILKRSILNNIGILKKLLVKFLMEFRELFQDQNHLI